jgi:hypothetical protein
MRWDLSSDRANPRSRVASNESWEGRPPKPMSFGLESSLRGGVFDPKIRTMRASGLGVNLQGVRFRASMDTGSPCLGSCHAFLRALRERCHLSNCQALPPARSPPRRSLRPKPGSKGSCPQGGALNFQQISARAGSLQGSGCDTEVTPRRVREAERNCPGSFVRRRRFDLYSDFSTTSRPAAPDRVGNWPKSDTRSGSFRGYKSKSRPTRSQWRNA